MKLTPLILIWVLFVSDSSAQIAVITHKSVPTDSIRKSDILDFYTGDRRLWEDGTAVVLFDLKPRSQIKDQFYEFLGKSTSRMKSIWLKNKLSGEGKPPVGLDTEADILARVSETPGAIGYVRHSMLTPDVKVMMEINLY